MGVQGLQYYVEKCCPGACREVSIRQLADEYRSRRNVEPVLVIDGMSCIKYLYGNLCWIMSGQWREFIEQLKVFVERFRSLGITPVFFFDGATVGAKRSTWVARRLRSQVDVQMVFDEVCKARCEPPKFDFKRPKKDWFQLPASMGTLTRYALKYECGCDVRTSIRECDEEITAFARGNNCFALMGNDSDYIVSNTAPYLLANSFNQQTLMITMVDRNVVAQCLKLRVEHLPLLACLRGNDVVPERSLTAFHQELVVDYRNIRVLLGKIAQFIRFHSRNDFDPNLANIAAIVFRDKSKVDLLQKGLETYGVENTRTRRLRNECLETGWPADDPPKGFVPRHSPRVIDIAKTKHIGCENPGIYSIMCGHEYDSSTALEDQRINNLPQCALLYRPIRQRTYSLLLGTSCNANSSQQTVGVLEWCVYEGNDMKKPDLVPPIPLNLPGGSPSLEDLWLGGSEVDRWGAFFACVSVTFNQEVVANVAPHFIVFCSIINYLIQFTNIEAWEVEAFVAQAVSPIAQSLSRLSQVKLSRLDLRAIQLATIFMRGVTSVQMALGACGHPLPFRASMPWHFFDGKLFHECYILAKNGTPPFGLCDNEAAVLEQFHQLMGVIVFKTRLADWSFW